VTDQHGSRGPGTSRHEPVFPNTTHVARREYLELVRSRLFHVSTVTLTILAIIVALLPIAAKLAERSTVSRVAIVAEDASLAQATMANLDLFLNRPAKQFEIIQLATADGAIQAVDDRQFEAALVAKRETNGRLDFTFHMGETIGDARIWILPNPSGLNASFPGFQDKLIWFEKLREFMGEGRETRV